MFNLATKTITYKSVEWQTENVTKVCQCFF